MHYIIRAMSDQDLAYSLSCFARRTLVRAVRRAAVPLLLAAAGAAPAADIRRPVVDVVRDYGFHSLTESANSARLQNPVVALEIECGSRRMLCNGVLIWLNGPCLRSGRSWTFSDCDVNGIVEPLLRPAATAGAATVRTVVIDPGHGGEDPGAIGAQRVCEKKVALDIAGRVAARLQDSGVVVRMTRSGDQAVPLSERPWCARRWGANLFVSIHLNSSRNGDASGLETYVVPAPGYASTCSTRPDVRACDGNRFDAQNALLAYYLHKGVLSTAHSPDRGIKRARFEVLTEAPCPAALVECGFVSNRGEAGRLRDADYRSALADGIARGILTYVSRSEGLPQPMNDVMPVACK
jgi:N-acetylmuramoyl-L-alanine amidase